MSVSFTASQALFQLQDILVNCLDGEYCNSKIDDALGNDLEEVELDLSGKELNLDSAKEVDNNNAQNQVQVNQDLTVKDITVWRDLATSCIQRGHLQQQNILSFKPGPIAFVAIRTIDCTPLISLCVLFDRAMLRNTRKYPVAETHGFSDKINWDVILDELDNFVGLVIVSRILKQRIFDGKFVGINVGVPDV